MQLMPPPSAFTSAAMSAALEDTPISYEDLADLERDFDDVDTEISEWAFHMTGASQYGQWEWE